MIWPLGGAAGRPGQRQAPRSAGRPCAAFPTPVKGPHRWRSCASCFGMVGSAAHANHTAYWSWLRLHDLSSAFDSPVQVLEVCNGLLAEAATSSTEVAGDADGAACLHAEVGEKLLFADLFLASHPLRQVHTTAHFSVLLMIVHTGRTCHLSCRSCMQDSSAQGNILCSAQALVMKTRTLAKHAPEKLPQLTHPTLELLKTRPQHYQLLCAAAETLSTISASSSDLSEAQLEVGHLLHILSKGQLAFPFVEGCSRMLLS